jgi:hypothetical protein
MIRPMEGSSPPLAEAISAPGAGTARGDAELFCPGCGYDLRGSANSDRCPECGLAIDREELGVSRIPWTHRRRIGRVRAYWRTVFLVTFRARRLAAEVIRPVDYHDAQRFRIVTSLIAALSVNVVLVAAVSVEGMDALAVLPEMLLESWSNSSRPAGSLDLMLPLAAGVLTRPVVPLGVVLFTLLVSGVASYWFHPARQPIVRQNRAVALSHYACAPLAFVPLPALAFGIIMLLSRQGGRDERPLVSAFAALLVLAIITAPVIVLVFYAATLRLLHGAAGAGPARMWLAAFAIPLTWLLAAMLSLVVLPWVVGFIWLVIESLR